MTTPDLDQQHALLRFARDVYTQPGIQALCLRLQDEQNVDVVLLLMCCWYGCYRGLLTEAQFEQAAVFSGTWATQLVNPLRQSRRWSWKPNSCNCARWLRCSLIQSRTQTQA